MLVKILVIFQDELLRCVVNGFSLFWRQTLVEAQQVVLVVTPGEYFTSTGHSEALRAPGINLTNLILLDLFLYQHGLLGPFVLFKVFFLLAQLLICIFS